MQHSSKLFGFLFAAMAGAVLTACNAEEAVENGADIKEFSTAPADGEEVGSTSQAIETCQNVTTPPANAGFTYSGNWRVRLPNILYDDCAKDDGITRTGSNGAVTYGRVTTTTCSSTSQRWSIYESPGYVAFCKPGTLKKCTTDGVLYHYFAKCAFIAATVTGDAEIANMTLSIQSGSSWNPVLPFEVDKFVSPPSGFDGHYLTDRGRTTRKYLSREMNTPVGSVSAVGPDLRRLNSHGITTQLWDFY